MSEHNAEPAAFTLPHKMTVEGAIHFPGALVIAGTVEGDVTCGSVVVSERGIVNGSIRADTVTVLGEVNGEIYATVLTLKTASSVIGNIFHTQLKLEDGCFFEGRSRRHSTPLLLAT